jgi:hypothetical protein
MWAAMPECKSGGHRVSSRAADPAHFGGHPPDAPTDHLWSTSWSIPEDYPTGSFNYKVIATALDGTTQSWEPVNVKPSLLTVIAGTFEPPAK